MSSVRVAGIAAAAVLVGAGVLAQSTNDQSSSTKKASVSANTTVVGCLMKETDYRKAHGFGKGTISGAGLGDEYVLVGAGVAPNASTSATASGAPSSSSGAASSSTPATCSESETGMAYRPTGHLERDLKPFLGQRVEVTGHFQHVKDAEATSVAPGRLPPEIVVRSYRAAPASASATQAANTAEPPSAEPAPVPAPAPESTQASAAPSNTAPVGTSGLPKTAGDEPLIGLIGLISVGAGMSLKRLRRTTA